MNILFYCSEYPPYKSGGIGTVTKIVAEELVQRGHKISVIGYYPDLKENYIHQNINGVTVIRYNLGFRNTKLKERCFQILRRVGLDFILIRHELKFVESKIEEYISKNKIEILELTDYYPFVACKRQLDFKRFTIPTILRVHGSVSFIESLSGHPNRYYKENDQRHFQRCDYVSAVSHYSLKYIQDNFTLSDVKGWNVIYNPIDISFINKSKPSTGADILFIGKLTETKGCYSLIKAFNKCAEKNNKVRLKLVGSGNIEIIKSLIDHRFIDRVIFLGYCNRERLKEEIDSCSFACIPSYFETFGMVAIEVMGRNRTIVYTNRTSASELITDSVEGFLVDPVDIELMSCRILELINSYELRDKMANHAYDKVINTFNASIIVSELERFYSKI